MPDFSHYDAVTAKNVANSIARHGRPTDEMLLEAVQRLDPPILPEKKLWFVIAILAHKRGRRFQIDCSTLELADEIRAIRRADAPHIFLNALAERILAKRGLSAAKQSMRSQKMFESQMRNMIIASLYRYFFDAQDGNASVVHPILGEIAVPQDDRTRRDRAIAMTREFLDPHYKTNMISDGTIRNIASAN